MIDNDKKNIFLKELEEEEKAKKIENNAKQKPVSQKKGGFNATAIFASLFVFFLFIIVLLIFLLSLSSQSNPIFENFGVQAGDIKIFLADLVNKTFFFLSIFLLLFFGIGVFRGFSLPKEQKKSKRGSFIFGAVSGGLIFLVAFAWIGSLAFINHFVVPPVKFENIIMVNIDETKSITAPVNIEFSADPLIKLAGSRGKKIKSFRWSKDGGDSFTNNSYNSSIKFPFYQKGRHEIVVEVTFEDGQTYPYTRFIEIENATFLTNPNRKEVEKDISFDASNLVEKAKSYTWDFGDGTEPKTIFNGKTKYRYAQPGQYDVKLEIKTINEAIYDFEGSIQVFPPQGKSISASIISQTGFSGESPLKLNLSGEQSFSHQQDIIQYQWEIIGPNTKKTQNGSSIDHQFTEPGNYSVSLTVIGENGEKDIAKEEVIVSKGNTPPNAVLETKPERKNQKKLEGSVPFEVVFSADKSTDIDNNITSYTWIFGEGEEHIRQGSEVKWVFRETGEYEVKLIVQDSQGEKDEENIFLTVRENPLQATIEATPETGIVPMVVEFDGSQSKCTIDDCRILSFFWDFDDNTPPQQSGAQISHQFTKAGTYEVTMRIITSSGDEATATKYIAVTNPPLVSCFIPSRSSGIAPLSVTFDSSSCSKGDIEQYKWDFGNGKISQKRKPTHTFTKPGEYKVTLQVFDKNGQVGSSEQVITVQ